MRNRRINLGVGPPVGVEIVHHQRGLDRVGVAFIEHAFDEPGLVLARAPLGHLDVSPARQRLELHKNLGRAVADIFVIEDLAVAGRAAA